MFLSPSALPKLCANGVCILAVLRVETRWCRKHGPCGDTGDKTKEVQTSSETKNPQATVGPEVARFMKIELEHRIPSPPAFAGGIGFAVLSGRGGVRLDTEVDHMRL